MIIEVKHFEFLDELRESGATNMFGATSYLKEEFPELSNAEATYIHLAWMDTFDEVSSIEERIEKANQ